jgi:gamma-glutamylputrescine oxidase
MISSPPVWSNVPLPPCTPFPGGTLRADVAVIGAGFAGLSAAYHLLGRRPGVRLIVLEAGRLGAGASGRNTGMLGPGVGQNLARLARTFGPETARALYRATLRAVEDVRRLVVEEQIDCELEMTGQLVVARGRGGRRRVAALASLLRRMELPGETVADAELERTLRLAPEAAHRESGPAALRLPIAGTLHPVRLLGGLAERVRRRGGTIYENARVTRLGDGRPVCLALEGGGEVLASDVVVATAGYTSSLGLLRGRVLPIHLQAVVTDPLDARARDRIGWAGREGVLDSRRVFSYFRLTPDDRIVFGGGLPRYRGPAVTSGGRSEAAALQRLSRDLHRTFPAGARLRVAGGWGGVIGYTLDGLPAIGRLPDRPAVLHVVGWCGHGVALALASGRWVTHLLCDGATPEDLPWYRSNPPLLPSEPMRRLAAPLAVRALWLLDQLA